MTSINKITNYINANYRDQLLKTQNFGAWYYSHQRPKDILGKTEIELEKLTDKNVNRITNKRYKGFQLALNKLSKTAKIPAIERNLK